MNSLRPSVVTLPATILYGEDEVEIAKGDIQLRLSRQEFGRMVNKGVQVGYFVSPQYATTPACQRGSFFDMKA